ncbi:hypothetical protein ACFWIN_11680 [Streptomyces sp. NPDC127049]|uniref:hypothetical protein n=1 Tax=Streptomyces sp. NPDC127049 TaxID=3347118 RepID=UPI00366173AA
MVIGTSPSLPGPADTGAAAHAAARARSLYDRPDACSDAPAELVAPYAPGLGRAGRREALRPVYEALVAELGEPTLYGGSAAGPSARWHTGAHVVLLAGGPQGATLSVHTASDLHGREYSTVESGSVGWRAEGPHGFDALPYLWLLHRGPERGWPAFRWDGHHTAASWEHLESSLELLLDSWMEQLPVQAPGEWASFVVGCARDWPRHLRVGYSQDPGRLSLMVDHRTTAGGPGLEETMRERGWQVCDGGWWRAEFPDEDPSAARSAARLLVADVRARGSVCPDELVAWEPTVNDRGHLWLPGIGMPVG